MESLGKELKQVLRKLARAPMFTAITLITLAAGVGANTVVFSVLEGVLLKPLPYPKPDELIGVWLTAPGIQVKEFELSPSDCLSSANKTAHSKTSVFTRVTP
jgi:hypothetical protein